MKITIGSFILILFGYLLFSQQGINPDGYNIFYYNNGQVASEGFFKNGKPDGYWKTYYENGILKSEGVWLNNSLDSTWVFYNNEGDTIEKISYYSGSKNGYHFTYYVGDSNSVKAKELYINNKLEGYSYYYFPGGSTHEIISYRENQKHGLGKEFSDNGNIITLYQYSYGRLVNIERINRYNKQNLKNGVWREYYDNDRIKNEITYVDGLKNGIYKEYDEDGNLKKTFYYTKDSIVDKNFEIIFEVDVRKEYDSLGNLIFQGAYKSDTPVAIHRYYDTSEVVVKAVTYDHKGNIYSNGVIDDAGLRQGDFVYFYPSGEVRAKGKYLNNRRIGKWYFYFIN